MEDVCRLHWSEKSVPEGSFPPPTHRLGGRFYIWQQSPELPQCLLGLSPNCYEGVRPTHDFLHHPFWPILLRDDVILSEEHGGHVPAMHDQIFR
jgi:hypothetical protein